VASPDRLQRLERILRRLIERTEADEITWEKGAGIDSWAVNVATSRFRIRRVGGEGSDFSLDIMGPEAESLVAPTPTWATLLGELHSAARTNARRHAPDALKDVEAALGLDASDVAER
jgi:hypothetical protein